MGCVCIKNKKTPSTPQPKTYSWDVRRSQNFDPKDYIVENIEGREIIRCPGTINGQQFVIQNCKNALIFVLDYCNTVTIDECTDCTIVLGAVKSSVFLRNSTTCTCIVACGQFRARDCRKCAIYIHCETQPIIEASTKIKFGNYFLSYTDLNGHLKNAALNVLKKGWVDVHDFTPVERESNWTFMEPNKNDDYVLNTRSESLLEELNNLGVSWKNKNAAILSLESTV